MNRMRALIQEWEAKAHIQRAAAKMTVQLDLADVAKIRALTQLYPGLSEERVVADLLSAALAEVEEALPYVQGNKVVAEDEFGDAIYEDVGKTPDFQRLTHQHLAALERQRKR